MLQQEESFCQNWLAAEQGTGQFPEQFADPLMKLGVSIKKRYQRAGVDDDSAHRPNPSR